MSIIRVCWNIIITVWCLTPGRTCATIAAYSARNSPLPQFFPSFLLALHLLYSVSQIAHHWLWKEILFFPTFRWFRQRSPYTIRLPLFFHEAVSSIQCNISPNQKSDDFSKMIRFVFPVQSIVILVFWVTIWDHWPTFSVLSLAQMINCSDWKKNSKFLLDFLRFKTR